MRVSSLWLARYESTRFEFAGAGETAHEAMKALGDEMRAHATEHQLDDWPPSDWREEAEVVFLHAGAGYTDWRLRT